MRERSTWNRDDVMKKAAALHKKADPYTMNQDHPQPPHDKYVTGDPSTFAEDVHSPDTWKEEYSGDQVKRDDIGMPEMRGDTFNHAEKTASERILLKKADLCVAVAELMLGTSRIASEKAVEDQAVALMHLPDSGLLATHARLAGDQGDDEDEDEGQDKEAAQQQQQQSDDDESDDDEGGEQQQDKQAAAPAPKTAKKAAEDDDAEDEDGQDKEASAEEKVEDGVKAKQAQDKEASQNDKTAEEMQQMAQQIVQAVSAGNYAAAQEQVQQMVQQSQQQMQQSQDQQQMAQQQQQLAGQIQQMIQEAMGQQQQQAPQAPAPQAQQMPSDDQALDQMLAADGCGPMAEADIQMDPAPMDVGMDDLGPEDQVLRTLFAQDQDDSEESKQDEQDDDTQDKQAKNAATRTVGTRPTAGVSQLGGHAKQAGKSDVDNLSNLWQSAPDVRDAFGLK